jgi:hypothetical protein
MFSLLVFVYDYATTFTRVLQKVCEPKVASAALNIKQAVKE